MWIFSYYTDYHQKKILIIAMGNRGSKAAVQPPPPPLNEVLALINAFLYPTSSTCLKQLKLGQRLEIDNRGSLSKFGDVT